MDFLLENVAVFLPLLLIDLGLRVYALIDILKQDRVVRWNNKAVWIIIACVVNFGWIFYFFFGKEE